MWSPRQPVDSTLRSGGHPDTLPQVKTRASTKGRLAWVNLEGRRTMKAHTRALGGELQRRLEPLLGFASPVLPGVAQGGSVERRRVIRGRFLALLAIGAAGICFPASAAASTYSVELTRTTGGVANISGENFADIGFGIGYAQAQDGICLLAETFLTVEVNAQRSSAQKGSSRTKPREAWSSRTSTRTSTGRRSTTRALSRSS